MLQNQYFNFAPTMLLLVYSSNKSVQVSISEYSSSWMLSSNTEVSTVHCIEFIVNIHV